MKNIFCILFVMGGCQAIQGPYVEQELRRDEAAARCEEMRQEYDGLYEACNNPGASPAARQAGCFASKEFEEICLN